MNDWSALLANVWHDTFGSVKCWRTDCPICSPTDWPTASWVRRRQTDSAAPDKPAMSVAMSDADEGPA